MPPQTGSASIQSIAPFPVNPAPSMWAFLGGSPSGGGTSEKDVFSLGGPTSTLNTLSGEVLLQCDDGPKILTGYYGYQRCEQYTVLDHENPPKPIKRKGIGFGEAIVHVPGLTNLKPCDPGVKCEMTGPGQTHKGGILWDNLAFGEYLSGASGSPQNLGSYDVKEQTITLLKTGGTVRVNCLDFEPTDVTLIDIIDKPNTPCTRPAH
jgi:hypothetical protein